MPRFHESDPYRYLREDVVNLDIIANIIQYAIDRMGVENVVAKLASIPGINLRDWSIAVMNPILSRFVNMTPYMVEMCGRTGVGLRNMVEKNMISREKARELGREIDIANGKYKKYEQNRLRQERMRQQRERLKRRNNISDQYLASGMHQSFENKLRMALQISE